MPDCKKSHLTFQNFLGEAPRPPAGARAFGARFAPLPSPLSKISGPAPDFSLRDCARDTVELQRERSIAQIEIFPTSCVRPVR